MREEAAEAQRLEQEQQQRAQERKEYRTAIAAYMYRPEENAHVWQFRYTWLQIFLLFFSALTATLAGIDGVPRWVVAVCGLVATFAGGLLTTFKIQDRIYANRKAVAEVQLECQRYDRGLDEYKEFNDPEEAFVKFSRTIIAIQGQQMLQEVELWNPKKDEDKKDAAVEKLSQEKTQKQDDEEKELDQDKEKERVLEEPQ